MARNILNFKCFLPDNTIEEGKEYWYKNEDEFHYLGFLISGDYNIYDGMFYLNFVTYDGLRHNAISQIKQDEILDVLYTKQKKEDYEKYVFGLNTDKTQTWREYDLRGFSSNDVYQRLHGIGMYANNVVILEQGQLTTEIIELARARGIKIEVLEKNQFEIKEGTHYVLKVDDVYNYLTWNEHHTFSKLVKRVEDSRIADNKKINSYLVINTDEPYADEIRQVIRRGEEKK